MTPDHRALILETLAAHGTVKQAIRAAYGCLPARAIVELREACATDDELRAACEAAERRERDGAKAPRADAKRRGQGDGGATESVGQPPGARGEQREREERGDSHGADA